MLFIIFLNWILNNLLEFGNSYQATKDTWQRKNFDSSWVWQILDNGCAKWEVTVFVAKTTQQLKKDKQIFLFGGFIASYESWCLIKQLCLLSTVMHKFPKMKNFVYPLCVKQNLMGTLKTLNIWAFNGQTTKTKW